MVAVGEGGQHGLSLAELLLSEVALVLVGQLDTNVRSGEGGGLLGGTSNGVDTIDDLVQVLGLVQVNSSSFSKRSKERQGSVYLYRKYWSTAMHVHAKARKRTVLEQISGGDSQVLGDGGKEVTNVLLQIFRFKKKATTNS